jgi:hypothetical protein
MKTQRNFLYPLPLGGEGLRVRGKSNVGLWPSLLLSFIEKENYSKPFRSQPISDHGVGTVRPWAAVDLNIAHRRHNVSARDGGLPASRRTGAGAFLCALLRPLLRMHLLQSCQCIHSTNHTIARRTPLFLSPATCLFIHGPAAAAGPASFIHRQPSCRNGNFQTNPP